MVCDEEPSGGLLPHPVVAPVALPAGQSALAELQIEPVLVEEQPAAADVAEGQQGFVARAAADVVQWRPQGARGIFRVHPEHERRIVRQRRGEGWGIRTTRWHECLGGRGVNACGSKARDGNRDQREPVHDWTIPSATALRGRLSRNDNTASMNACGWSMLTAWPAAGITAFFAPGIFAAI